MKAKAMTYLSRKDLIIKEHGEPVWNEIMDELIKIDHFFKNPILVSTMLPIESYLKFNDFVIDKLYGGDKTVMWKFGANGATWALKEGAYKTLLLNKDAVGFIKTASIIWKLYFDEGKVEVKINSNNEFEIHISELPVKHLLFEYLVMGYFTSGSELVTKRKVTSHVIKGFSKGVSCSPSSRPI